MSDEIHHPKKIKPSQEAFTLAMCVLKCAQKTSIKEAADELETLFYSPEELRTLRQSREMWRCYLDSLPMSATSEIPMQQHTRKDQSS